MNAITSNRVQSVAPAAGKTGKEAHVTFATDSGFEGSSTVFVRGLKVHLEPVN